MWHTSPVGCSPMDDARVPYTRVATELLTELLADRAARREQLVEKPLGAARRATSAVGDDIARRRGSGERERENTRRTSMHQAPEHLRSRSCIIELHLVARTRHHEMEALMCARSDESRIYATSRAISSVNSSACEIERSRDRALNPTRRKRRRLQPRLARRSTFCAATARRERFDEANVHP